MEKFILAYGIGTSGLKSSLFGTDGRLLGSRYNNL